MNAHDAKQILEMYRPGGADDSDPRFVEALQQVRNDRTLRLWFEEQKAFDSAVGGGVKSIPVPSDLKASILAGRKGVRLPWWQDGRIRAAVAASIVILTA